MKLVSVKEMQAIEKAADAKGHTYEMMMEQAGLGLASAIHELVRELPDTSALGLVGSGNNGGDTLVALAHLAETHGWRVSAYLVKDRPDDDPLLVRFTQAGGLLEKVSDDSRQTKLRKLVGDHAVLLDGILGTGARLPLKGAILKVLRAVGKVLDSLENPPVVVAVDCPSGVDCDSGQVAEGCLPASVTVTMAAVKVGMLRFPAYGYVGMLRLVGIGLDENLAPWKKVKRQVPEAGEVRAVLPLRPVEAHKGTFGTVLVAGGSVNYTGAVWLTGQAAYRIGAGLVTLAVPTPLHMSLAGQFPEATWLLLPHEVGVISGQAAGVVAENLARVSAIAIGPGMGLEPPTQEFISRLLIEDRRPVRTSIGFVGAARASQEGEQATLPPLVIDADGLKLLSRLPDWHQYLPAPAVLTPHPGEMAILTGMDKEAVQADRMAVAERYAAEWGHVVVLKGALTVVASPDGRTAVIPVATPALARAGTGDVLTGLIVGLRAQGVEAYPAALAGAWLHAQAGLVAAEILGSTAAVLAGDVLDAVVDVLGDLG